MSNKYRTRKYWNAVYDTRARNKPDPDTISACEMCNRRYYCDADYMTEGCNIEDYKEDFDHDYDNAKR